MIFIFGLLIGMIVLIVTQGYMESIFERIEVEISNPTVSNIQDWLSGKGTAYQKKREGYLNAAIQYREPFSVIQRAEATTNIDELLDLELEADSVEVGRRRALSVVRGQLEVASRAVGLPRAPSQPDIARVGEWTPLFADIIEDIASDKGLTVTSEAEWKALDAGERRVISRSITHRLTGR